jgi:hypothetical protein
VAFLSTRVKNPDKDDWENSKGAKTILICNAMSNKSSDLVAIDPLWIPIHFDSTIEEEEEMTISDNTIGKCSFYNGSSSSHFFLQSNLPYEIDNKVLFGI